MENDAVPRGVRGQKKKPSSLLFFFSRLSGVEEERGWRKKGREDNSAAEFRAAVLRVAFRGVIINGGRGRGASQQVGIYLGGCILNVSVIYIAAS